MTNTRYSTPLLFVVNLYFSQHYQTHHSKIIFIEERIHKINLLEEKKTLRKHSTHSNQSVICLFVLFVCSDVPIPEFYPIPIPTKLPIPDSFSWFVQFLSCTGTIAVC